MHRSNSTSKNNTATLRSEEIVEILRRRDFPTKYAKKFKDHYINGAALLTMITMPEFLEPFIGLQLQFNIIFEELTGKKLPLVRTSNANLDLEKTTSKTKNPNENKPTKFGYGFTFGFIAINLIAAIVVISIIVTDYNLKQKHVARPAVDVISKHFNRSIINYGMNVTDGLTFQKDMVLEILKKGENATESEKGIVETYKLMVRERIEAQLRKKLLQAYYPVTLVNTTGVTATNTAAASTSTTCADISVSDILFSFKSFIDVIFTSYTVKTNCVSTTAARDTALSVRDAVLNSTIYTDLVIPFSSNVTWNKPTIEIKPLSITSTTTNTTLAPLNTCPGAVIPFGQSCNVTTSCPCYLVCVNDTECKCPADLMWNGQECLPCPKGWDLYANHCYKLYKDTKTWDDAKAYCISQGSHLAKIDNAAEHTFLYNYYVANAGFRVWTGARSYTPYQFVWSLDNTAFSRNSPFWCPGEPNNRDGSLNPNYEPCVYMVTYGGQICVVDSECSYWTSFLCEKS